MPRISRAAASVLLAILLIPLAPRTADAIPAFARKYRVTCALCHAPFPRLNAFGEVFAGNGFQMVRGETAVDTMSVGDPLLRLQQSIPLAIRVDAYMSALTETDDQRRGPTSRPRGASSSSPAAR